MTNAHGVATRTSAPAISIVHATYRAGGRALDVRSAWLGRAVNSHEIEYIFGYDEDDEISSSHEQIVVAGVKGDSNTGLSVTAVRNWNAAAKRSIGRLIVVVADDLVPPAAWDQRLHEAVGALSPMQCAFVVKVTDSDSPADHLIRHPIVSRRYLAQYGLFDPRFEGHYADVDFTLRSHLRGLVIDARSIVLSHEHPRHGFSSSESHGRMSTSQSAGLRVFDDLWSERRRRVQYRYLRPGIRTQCVPWSRIVWRRCLARWKWMVPVSLVRSLRVHR